MVYRPQIEGPQYSDKQRKELVEGLLISTLRYELYVLSGERPNEEAELTAIKSGINGTAMEEERLE